MNTQSKILITVLFIFILIFGFAVGILWNDLPLINFNKEVKLTEVITILTTLGIGIFIPLLVKKWIEDSKSVKSYLVDEVKVIITTLSTIKIKIKERFDTGSISQKDKDDVNYLFHTAELQITSFKEQLQVAFPNQVKKVAPSLTDSYNRYKDFLTDGPFMVSSFDRIDDRFFREHNQEYTKIDGHLKVLVQQLYKL
jgi:hypothetical protein